MDIDTGFAGSGAARWQVGPFLSWARQQPVHIHLDPFEVVGRGTTCPDAFDAGWKDTIDLVPGEQARIAVRFRDHAGRFVFHCHNLEREDMAMMANFVTHAGA